MFYRKLLFTAVLGLLGILAVNAVAVAAKPTECGALLVTEEAFAGGLAGLRSKKPKARAQAQALLWSVFQSQTARLRNSRLGNSLGFGRFDDVAQDVAIKVFELASAGEVENMQHFRALTSRTFRFRAIDELRKTARYQSTDNFDSIASSEVESDSENRLAAMEEQQNRERLAAAFRAIWLKPDEKKLLYLRLAQGQSSVQIAKKLHKTEAWCRTTFRRITIRLKSEIKRNAP